MHAATPAQSWRSFFQGMSDSALRLTDFSAQTLAHAVSLGSEYAHDALADPKEGTILSVIAAFAGHMDRHMPDTPDAPFAPLVSGATEAARVALTKTEQQLEVLRKAGVVDAGARGFVVLAEGITDYLVDGTETAQPEIADSIVRAAPMLTAGSEASPAFRYCTECVVNGEDIDRRKLRESLSILGDSLVLAGTKRKAKIHIHVDDPDAVFTVAGQFGTVSGMKADDMDVQQHSTHDARAQFAVITDSAADIADEDLERLDIHLVPCRIQFGERGYLDKVSITTEEFFDKLAAAETPPTTSQPAPGDFRRQYQYLATHFPDVVSINLTPRVSGTFQAAESAASRINASGRVHVVNSQNASIGQGLLAVFAAECSAAGVDVETTLAALRQLIPRTASFALIRDLQYAVRGGRVPASRNRIADWLRLTPVVSTRADGSLSTSGVLPGRKNLVPKFARYVAKRCNPDAELHVALGHAVCRQDAERLREELTALLPNVTRATITGMGSAVGAHGGPGSIVVGVQEYVDPASLR